MEIGRLWIKAVTVLAVSLAAVACGGGGSDGPAVDNTPGPIDKYIGTFGACVATGDPTVQSVFTTFSFSKLGPTRASAQVGGQGYLDVACRTIANGGSVTFPGTVTIDGSGTASGVPVDLASFASTDPRFPLNGKDILYLNGTQLQFGGTTVGADGYPTAIDTSVTLIRQ